MTNDAEESLRGRIRRLLRGSKPKRLRHVSPKARRTSHPRRRLRPHRRPPANQTHRPRPHGGGPTGGILMRRMLILGGFAAAVLTVTSAHADWHEFWHRVGVDFHRNNAWPEPFVSADRQVTREYFRIQVNNGWRFQNTVGKWFYDEETNALNQAGEIKLRQIVTQSPVHRRTVFVLMGTS